MAEAEDEKWGGPQTTTEDNWGETAQTDVSRTRAHIVCVCTATSDTE